MRTRLTTEQKLYAAYKNAYRSNKRYRDKINNDDYAAMLSERDWKEAYSLVGSNKELVYNQFHFYSRESAKKIKKSLHQEGFDLSIRQIQSRDYSDDVYDVIKNTYADLRKSMNSYEASNLIAYTYYGS